MADVITLERFEVHATPVPNDAYSVIVERLPLVPRGARQKLLVSTKDLVGWFRVHACTACALAVHKREQLSPAHCGVSKAAISKLGFDPAKL